MVVLDRRVQILLDPEQYSALEAEARQTHRSVASLIREAIDNRGPGDLHDRQAAIERLFASADEKGAPFDPDEFKNALKDDIESRFTDIPR